MGSLRHAAGARVSAGAETGDVAKIVVRDARADDQLALQDIFQRASLGNAGDREALLSHPEALQLSPDLISAGRTRVATRADGTVVGFASTSLREEASLELDDLFVSPGWQRRGVARRLIAQIVAEAESEGYTRISVTANDHALAFYRNAKFVDDGPVETAFGVGTRMHIDVRRQSRFDL